MFTEPTDDTKTLLCTNVFCLFNALGARVRTGCLAVLNGQMNARFRPPHSLALMPGTVFPRQWQMLSKARGGQSEPKMHLVIVAGGLVAGGLVAGL